MIRKSRVLCALVTLSMMTAACGGDDDDSADTGSSGDGDGGGGAAEELTPIKVGILPLAGLAPLWYGIEQGYFADEGLEVTTEIGEGGAALTPAVLGNDYQFAIGEYTSLLQARENDVAIQVVSNLTNGASEADQGINGLLVKADSGIETAEDLAGKTVAVNGLGGADDVTLRAILDDAGVDPTSVELTEVPFPDMIAAVESGEVDAASEPEPFVTLGEEAGLVSIFDPYYEAIPSMPLGLVFGAEEWLDENQETAEAFIRALDRSIEAASDTEAMKEVIVANTDIDAELVDQIALDRWDAEVNDEGLQTLSELAVRYEVLEAEPDLDALVWTPE